MKDNGLVSIITPAYNCERFIVETIQSIQAQTYRNWELVITDDGSTDSTYNILRELANSDSRIKILRFSENKGSGVARNNSILHAEGRYIAFCDSDDIWAAEKLERQIDFMERTGCDLSYSSYGTCDEKGEINGYVECLPYIDKFRITRDNGIGCLTAIYDTSRIGKHFMPVLRKRQDWGLWINIISKSGKALGLQEPLAIYRHHTGSISSNKFRMIKYNYAIYRQVLGFSHLKSSLYLGAVFLPYYFYKKLKQKFDFRALRKQESAYKNLFSIKGSGKTAENPANNSENTYENPTKNSENRFENSAKNSENTYENTTAEANLDQQHTTDEQVNPHLALKRQMIPTKK